MVDPRTVVERAKATQDLMHEEREELPWEFWEVGQSELTRFSKVAWPTTVGLRQ